MIYDLVIVGGGPIGASTAYFLKESGFSGSLAIVDDRSNERALYKNAGGCLRWTWDDDLKREMTSQTAEFIKQKADEGYDFSLISDYYYFVYNGKFTPALNLKGAALVDYFLDEAVKSGAMLIDDRVESLKSSAAEHTLTTKSGARITAKKVLFATGIANETFVKALQVPHEKRQIFVLDTVINEESKALPHTIVPVGDEGYGFVFLKKIDNKLRLVVGQEDIVEDSDETSAVDYYAELMNSDFGNIMPYLKNAKVEKILWGVDAGNKKLEIFQNGSLFAAHCGSAVRSCVYIGRQVAKALTKN